MLNFNFHTHTDFCDGKNTPEEMAKSAFDLGFEALGFSVHSPMNFENDYAIQPQRLDEYFERIENLKEEYSGKLEIYNGIELDSDSLPLDYSRFDFRIGAVHQLHSVDRIYSIDNTADELSQCVKNEFDSDFLSMAKQYYSDYARFICQAKPEIAAHFDLITKFNESNSLFDENNTEYQMITLLYLERICLECPDIIFEVNTGAMYRLGNKKPYPARFILDFLRERNMRITVSSDAHCTNALNFGFDSALNLIKDCGFKKVWRLKNGKFEAVEV